MHGCRLSVKLQKLLNRRTKASERLSSRHLAEVCARSRQALPPTHVSYNLVNDFCEVTVAYKQKCCGVIVLFLGNGIFTSHDLASMRWHAVLNAELLWISVSSHRR